MADIIDFRAKSKPYRKANTSKDSSVELGQIILFSGVRFERDETTQLDDGINKSSDFLTSKSN